MNPRYRRLVIPGALIAIKGQRLAIEALAQLPEAHLALAGTGEDEEYGGHGGCSLRDVRRVKHEA